jgi:hypothetical protein
MPQLHARGLELVWELSSAADYPDQISREELRTLLRETSTVLAELLNRDVPRRAGPES